MIHQTIRRVLLLAGLLLGSGLNAAVITYSFTADGSHSSSFSYDSAAVSVPASLALITPH